MHVVVQQQILGLEIAVHDHVPMAVVDTGDDLLEEATRVVLLQFAMLHDVVEQLPATHVLHDHEDVSWGGYYLEEGRRFRD